MTAPPTPLYRAACSAGTLVTATAFPAAQLRAARTGCVLVACNTVSGQAWPVPDQAAWDALDDQWDELRAVPPGVLGEEARP